MARILIGWELGAGDGHRSRLIELATVLAKRGHTPLFAPQQIGPFAAHGPTWQAPVWPRMLQSLYRRFGRSPATMGDILAYLGLDDVEAVAAMLGAWDRLITDSRPDAVVAEYAPMLQLAARGRVPVLAWGTGFSLPPDHLPNFPSFTGQPAATDEGELLCGVNDGLKRLGRSPLSALPEIFLAERTLVAAFGELDPYRQDRRMPAGAPAVRGPIPPATGEGDELFIYFNGIGRRTNAFWQGMAGSRLAIRVYDPMLNETDSAELEGAGIHVARKSLPFAEIVARSRIVLSHGGLGFVSSCLVAGLPQIIMPFDAEKWLIADAVVERGLCLRHSFTGLDPEAFAAFLRAAWSDEALAARSRAAAPDFRARMGKTSEVEAADIVEALL